MSADNMSMTALHFKRILALGLSTMSVDARKERMENVMEGNVVKGSVLAALFDECRYALTLFVDHYKHNDNNNHKHKVENFDEIMTMLNSVDGKTAVASLEADELVDMVLELREKSRG